MALDLDALLAPVSDDQPAGEDLSYDRERSEIEQAFEREETFGEEAAEPEERDWRSVVRLIEGQFARTKDVWLAVYLARAGAESGSLETVEIGVEVLAGLFERYWDTVHPQLDELGVPGRKSPCDSLTNRRSFLAPLSRVSLIAHPRLGTFSSLDLERFRLEGAQADGYGLFRGALEEIGQEGLQQALARVGAIEAALRRADRAFTAGAGGEEGPNFAPTYAVLSQMAGALRSFISEPAAPDEGTVEAEAGGAAAGAGGPAGSPRQALSGAIGTRDDVRRALGLIGDYYRKYEPGHPMPMMIERAIRWVDMDYVTLMKDIAPQGVNEAVELLNTRAAVFD